MVGSQNSHFLIPLSGWFSPVEKKLQGDLAKRDLYNEYSHAFVGYGIYDHI